MTSNRLYSIIVLISGLLSNADIAQSAEGDLGKAGSKRIRPLDSDFTPKELATQRPRTMVDASPKREGFCSIHLQINTANRLRHSDSPEEVNRALEIFMKIVHDESISKENRSWAAIGVGKISSRRNEKLLEKDWYRYAMDLCPDYMPSKVLYGLLPFIWREERIRILKPVVLMEEPEEPWKKKYYIQALIGLGNARDRDSKIHYRRALEVARRLGNVKLQVQALIGLGNARDGGVQIPHYRQALEIAERLGDLYLQAQALIGLGNARDRDDKVHYHRALEVSERLGNLNLQAQALIGLGNARDGGVQIPHYRRALEIAEHIGDYGLIKKANDGIDRVLRLLTK